MLEQRLLKSAREGRLARELVRLGLWEPELLEVEFHQPPDNHTMHNVWMSTHPHEVSNYNGWQPVPDRSNMMWIFVSQIKIFIGGSVCRPFIYTNEESTSDENFWNDLMIMVRHNIARAKADEGSERGESSEGAGEDGVLGAGTP